jgi:hypothetical protein
MNILNNTEAVRLLQDGCRRLELPYYTATELVKFLQVKRVHDSCLSDKARPDRKLSPGAALDRLWHWMLLNTKARMASLPQQHVGWKRAGQGATSAPRSTDCARDI